MKILITGATGRIGSRVVPYLIQKDFNISVLVRDVDKAKFLDDIGAELIKGDLLDPSSLDSSVNNVDVVLHLAAQFRVRNDDEIIKNTNEIGTINLAESAYKNKVKRFVFTSTSLVYGSSNLRPNKEEDEIDDAKTIYPKSKITAEKYLLQMYKDKSFDVRIARLGFVYGSGDPHLSEVIPLMKRWNFHPAQRLHMVHHNDISQALLSLILTDGIDGRIYNVADDAPLTAYEIALMEGNSDVFNGNNGPIKNTWEGILDTRKIRRETNFRPSVPTYYFARDYGLL